MGCRLARGLGLMSPRLRPWGKGEVGRVREGPPLSRGWAASWWLVGVPRQGCALPAGLPRWRRACGSREPGEWLCHWVSCSWLCTLQQAAARPKAGSFLDEQARMAALSLEPGDQCEQHPRACRGWAGQGSARGWWRVGGRCGRGQQSRRALASQGWDSSG